MKIGAVLKGIVLLAVGIVKLISDFNDPKKRKALYQLHLTKKAKKALEAAEQTYFIVDDLLADINDPNLWEEKSWKRELRKMKSKYHRLRKRFFANE